MPLFHEEEKTTIWVLESHEDEHPGTRYIISFNEGDRYLCEFFTAFEDMNEFEDNDPRFDEYMTIWMRVKRVIKRGPNVEDLEGPDGIEKDALLDLNYQHFPSVITTKNGEQVYPPVE